MIDSDFCRLHHVFHERFAVEPTRVILIILGGMDLFLACWPVHAAKGDILERSAETAHGVPFEMGEHQHRVVIQHMFADLHFFEVLPAFDRDHHRAVLVHNVYRTEIRAVDLRGFPMIGRGVSIAFV